MKQVSGQMNNGYDFLYKKIQQIILFQIYSHIRLQFQSSQIFLKYYRLTELTPVVTLIFMITDD